MAMRTTTYEVEEHGRIFRRTVGRTYKTNDKSRRAIVEAYYVGAEWLIVVFFFFFSSRRRHTRLQGDWSSDVCSSDLLNANHQLPELAAAFRELCEAAQRS